MIVLTDIRKRLQEAIKESGMTQSEIARRLRISQATVAQYLSGR